MLIIKFLIVFIIILLFCQLFLATVQEGFKEGVDDNSCSPGVNQIPLLQDQVKTLKDDVAELKNNVKALNDVSNDQYKTDINQDELNSNANPAAAEEEETE
jgi:PHD/YefM family antitoxin component YafN of YafNO toxin-antitoxin module